ncbi:hypothetical protein [Flavilitoribacter nigricans]|uniref:Uncharacterized protein n=1 Tax=Flavilitoribacter nigricans (strain ATCC 23147 / DSM 23189 / NBRC 102662 / NCIMB 1420 / SS-2) TaxID=1122177 RepID=A0A2D0NGE3_FLAN2|nr:hypothetical protein [Flavilitoribacter nigricans]PHN06833.1 hypothetical protein CRP01_11150 [Flavilitoribacter nigricans DSM 23189 = NBRC 102662]
MKKTENSKGNVLNNPKFEIVVLWIQAHIGQLIVFLLGATYFSTALMIAVSLQDALLTLGPTLSWIVAAPMALFGQMIRGSLVYFNQANPYRISKMWEYLGMVFAFVLTVWACYEVHHLFSSQGIGDAAQISAIGFIVAGFFLEAYFLGEINRTNRSVLVANPDMIQQVIDYEREYADLQIAIGEAKIELEYAKRDRLSGALRKRQPTSAPKQAPTPLIEEHTHEPEEEAEDVISEPLFSFSTNGNGHVKN